MSASQHHVRVRRCGSTVTFQVEGWGRMTHSLPLRRCAEQALAEGATAVHVDLRHCTHMDSTFLGTLLCLKRTVDQREEREFALVCPSEQCHKVLRQMAVEGVFPLLTGPEPDAADWVELSGDMEDVEGFKHNVFHAHQELADLPGPASEPFREVVRSLAQELSDTKRRDK